WTLCASRPPNSRYWGRISEVTAVIQCSASTRRQRAGQRFSVHPRQQSPGELKERRHKGVAVGSIWRDGGTAPRTFTEWVRVRRCPAQKNSVRSCILRRRLATSLDTCLFTTPA